MSCSQYRCQARLQETQHTDNNKGKSGRECTENMSPQFISTNHGCCSLRKSQELFCINTHTTNRLFSLHESLPLQPRSLVLLVTCMHSHHTTHNTLCTDNVLYRTPEGTPIDLVHTHHVTSSGIQLVLVDDKLHHISMSFLSCKVQHVVSNLVSIMEQ